MQTSPLLVRFSLLFVLLVLVAGTTTAADRKPLFMEGKKTLYQRVLTRPDAMMAAQPGAPGGVVQPTFSRFYVYARKQQGEQTWLELGVDTRDTVSGWIPEQQTVPWKQQLVLAFSNPAGRQRSLFFATRTALEEVLDSEQAGQMSGQLLASAEQGKSGDEIVSIEPETYIDIQKQFYLLPILDSDETYIASGHTARLLEVASVTRDDAQGESAAKTGSAAGKKDEALLRSFKAAVVFVIDSTISMGPYIERTKEAMQRIYDHIEEARLLKRVKFGLIAYRSNIEATPGLQYVAQEFADPVEVKDGKDFLARVKDLQRATVSSAAFNEDTYAGLMLALNDVDWKAFGARYIVLVTDAGALPGSHKLSATGLGAEQVKLEALHRGIAIYTLHLKTPQGKKNHATAERQYRALSTHPLLTEPLYYPIKTGSVEQFGAIVDSLGDAIVAQVQAASRGEKVAGSATTAAEEYGNAGGGDDQQARVLEDAAKLGYAMQLAYLGSEQGTQAPPVFRGWITDIDLQDPVKRSVDVHILLTKKQLSDMQLVLKGIVDAASEGLTSPDKFYDSLRSFVSVLGRDPNAVVGSQATKIADMGLLGEYLDDLPYKSLVMNLDQDTWSTWTVQQQIDFQNSVKRKMRLYEIYNSDTDRWVSLAEGSDPADHVYPVPLDALP
jgi:hypothetical protein